MISSACSKNDLEIIYFFSAVNEDYLWVARKASNFFLFYSSSNLFNSAWSLIGWFNPQFYCSIFGLFEISLFSSFFAFARMPACYLSASGKISFICIEGGSNLCTLLLLFDSSIEIAFPSEILLSSMMGCGLLISSCFLSI